jgi:hypothetical protein
MLRGRNVRTTQKAKLKQPASARSAIPKTFYIFDPDAIQAGDILLTRAPSLKSKTIRKVTKTPFSHAALCINYGHFIEAIGSGVCRFNIMAVGVRDKDNVRLLRLKPSVPNAEAISRTAAEFGHQDLLRGYSLSGAIGVVVPSPKKPNEASLFCSQLVVEAYGKVMNHSLVPERKLNKIAPGHLLESPYLEDVTNLALRTVVSPEEARWHLDDPSPQQRPHEWETITKLKMLGSKSVQRALARLNTTPKSFFELELLLRDTRDQELDRVIVAALERADFCNKFYEKTLKAIDREDTFKRSIQLVQDATTGSMSNDQLAATINETKQAIRMFEDDLKDRTEQHKLYVQRAKASNLKAFAMLGMLQRRLMGLSQEILTLLKGQLQALEKVAARRTGLI